LQTIRSGDLLARIVSDIETLENFYVRAVIPPLAAALVTGLVCVLLGYFDLRLALVLFVFLALTGVALPFTNGWLSRKPAQELVHARAELNAGLVDQIQGLSDLLAYNQDAAQLEWLAQSNQQLVRMQERLAWIRGLGDGLAALFIGLTGLFILILAIPLISSGDLNGVYLALLPLAAIASFEIVQPLTNAVGQAQASAESARRLFELIDAAPQVIDSGQPTPLPAESNLVVQDLSFRYTPVEPLVLQNIGFNLPTGARLAIVGPSGAGKSSLMNLLLRFWDYSEGSLRVENQELRDLAAEEVRTLFAVVSQHPHLFNVTIRDNLLLANPDASDEQIVAACHTAQIHDFILDLPQGYDTLIGENGFRLSGGQHQRLAIARALLKKASILLLDEPTANLDPITERKLLHALLDSTDRRSVLTITHRLVGMEYMDEIIVLESGQIIQRGTHNSLSSEIGLYRQMLLDQNQLLFETGISIQDLDRVK
jgi:thiol reductant ABC exporter CydC subunit